MATSAELLVLVESAISGTLTRTGKLSVINGRTIETFSLPELFAIRRQLQVEVARDAGPVRPLVGRFRNPS